MIILRPYQEAAIDAIMAAMPSDDAILVQAATGAGKTIVFCSLIKRLLAEWPGLRIGVLAHRRELITQARDKMLSVWPDAPIGIACASVETHIETDLPVTIGSIQTLINRVNVTSPFDLIIVDEAHKIPPINVKSQYSKWLDVMRKYNPAVRVLGFTATPFRLNHGYIYGDDCRPGMENIFKKLHFRIGIRDLQHEGYLCGFRAKSIVDISHDLRGVKKSAGEYNLAALSDEMGKDVHIGSAVKALEDYAQDRKHVVVFGVTIRHAELLQEAFQSVGISAGIVHSNMPLERRDATLRAFETGGIRVIVNVMVLSEGWDSPAVDCIIMCRPTLSPGLYCQMTGRGLRPHADKDDVLILDLASNCMTHGDPDKPKVKTRFFTGSSETEKENDIRAKECPNCSELVPVATVQCPECEYTWPTLELAPINDRQNLKDVHFGKPEPEILYLTDTYFVDFTSRKGNRMVKVALSGTFEGSTVTQFVNHFFMFDEDAHEYARKRSRVDWYKIAQTKPPESTDEALERYEEFLDALNQTIEITADGKWWKISSWMPKTQKEYADAVPF